MAEQGPHKVGPIEVVLADTRWLDRIVPASATRDECSQSSFDTTVASGITKA
jgi:hypothetical protein